MDNNFKAHKSTFRKQQFKTYFVRILILPKLVFGGFSILLALILWTSLGKFIKSSNAKLHHQKEQYKIAKKHMKLDKKQIRKEIKRANEHG